MSVIVTGASGSLGASLLPYLLLSGHQVHAVTRSPLPNPPQHECFSEICSDWLFPTSDLLSSLDKCHTIVHAASLAHSRPLYGRDLPLRAYFESGPLLTQHIINLAITHNVKHIVYISSLGVLGNSTSIHPFTRTSNPSPFNNYTLSKFVCEQALVTASQLSSVNVTIIRPSLIYGPYVKGSLLSLIKFLKLGLPIVNPSFDNQRSFCSMTNITQFIEYCISSPPPRDIYNISDLFPVATSFFIKHVTNSLDQNPYIVSLSPHHSTIISRIPLIGSLYNSLYSNLVLDHTDTFLSLGWSPSPFSTSDVHEMAITV